MILRAKKRWNRGCPTCSPSGGPWKTLAGQSQDVLCRYVVCKGLKVGTDDVREYLFSVNMKLNQLRNTESDVNLVVPLKVIKEDPEFTDYMIRSNER